MSDLQRKLQSRGLPSGLPPRPGLGAGRGGSRRQGGGGGRCYSGLPWTQFWARKEWLETPEGRFCCYSAGPAPSPGLALATVVCLHGGGYSALSWSCLARELTNLVQCRVVALDLRGHGETECEEETSLSGEQLSLDVCSALGALPGLEGGGGVVLVGHSMGGAVAAHTAASQEVPGLVGLVVIDVVEGTALEALAGMQTLLANRPSKFTSVEQAVEWCVRTGQVRNPESARVSMPGQVVAQGTRVLAARLVAEASTSTTQAQGEDSTSPSQAASSTAPGLELGPPSKRLHVQAAGAIQEEEEDTETHQEMKPPEAVLATPPPLLGPSTEAAGSGFTWRIDLSSTEPHWSGWFTGLSSKFLGCPAPAKLLLLAGVDRLDRDLTIGQMQGKFQMQVLPQVGHTLHEDSPEKVAEVLATFLTRHKLAKPTEYFIPTLPGC